MADIGVAVREDAGAGATASNTGLRHQHGADRREAAAEALGDGHQVGRDALLLAGVQRAGAAHAAHHLVEDQQDAVTVADLAHALEIAGHGGGGAERRADDRLGDEGGDGAPAQLDDLGLQLAASRAP